MVRSYIVEELLLFIASNRTFESIFNSEFFPLVSLFGAYGMIYSSGVYYLIQIVMYFMALRKNFSINIKGATRRFIKMIFCSLVMVLPAFLIHSLIPFDYSSRILDILIMGVLGVLMLGIYYWLTSKINLLQRVFGIKDVSLRSLISRLRS